MEAEFMSSCLWIKPEAISYNNLLNIKLFGHNVLIHCLELFDVRKEKKPLITAFKWVITSESFPEIFLMAFNI